MRQQQQLLEAAFQRRVGHPNVGGSHGQHLVENKYQEMCCFFHVHSRTLENSSAARGLLLRQCER